MIAFPNTISDPGTMAIVVALIIQYFQKTRQKEAEKAKIR